MMLRGRMTLHFFIQFIIFFVVSLFTISSLLFLLIIFIIGEENDANPEMSLIENIPVFSFISNNQSVKMNADLIEQLKENNMWLQLINKDGKVIYSANTPPSLKESYSIHELSLMAETKQLDNYPIETYYDVWDEEAYYYVYGFDNTRQTMLEDLYQQFSVDGIIDSTHTKELEKLLDKQNGIINVYKDDELIQTVGSSLQVNYEKSDLLSAIHTPGKQKTTATIYNDEKTRTTWILHQPNEGYTETKQYIDLPREIKVLLLATVISFCFAVAFSIWNGYRYGKPLLLMINWLKGIENKQYHEVLSEKELKKIYKRNGKVKIRYRLYKEVIQSFTNMTEKLAISEKERQQLERTREEWMAGISHDLRTPLSSVQGYGHMLESDKYSYSKSELQQIGKVIREKSDYMVELVDDFSLVFKLKNSAITLQKTSVELNKFVGKTVAKFQRDLTMKDYSFVFESSTDTYVLIDPKWFERVLDNLLFNAAKHNPKNTIIKVKIKTKDKSPIIEIKDNGIGMDQAFLENLFDRYYRGTSTKERTEGEGLGMSIAKAIVDLHEGDIKVTSERNKGTTIKIIITNSA